MTATTSDLNITPSGASSSSTGPRDLHVFSAGLESLISAMRHTQDANFHKIMTNIQLLVFALCWFGMVRFSPLDIFLNKSVHLSRVNLNFQKTIKPFSMSLQSESWSYKETSILDYHEILSKSRHYGMTISQTALDVLQTASTSTGIVKSVQMAFHLATSISPLVALLPNKHNAKSVAFRKEALVAVGVCNILNMHNSTNVSYSTAWL